MNSDIKKIIVRACVYLVLFILVMLVLNFLFIRFVLMHGHGYRSIEQLNEVDSVDVLVVGDSHLYNSLNPELWENSFNFGYSGESYFQTYYKLRYVYEKVGLTPSKVILPFDFHTFSGFRSDRIDNEWYWHNFMSVGDMIGWSGEKGYFERFVSSYFPVIGRGKDIISILNLNDRVVYRGFLPAFSLVNFSGSDKRLDLANQRAKSHFDGYDVFDEKLVKAFRMTLNYLADRGVDVYLVRTPVSYDYFSCAVEYFGDVDLFNSFTDSLIPLSPMVHFLNYYDLYFRNDGMFSDSDHLNEVGSDAFTIRLKNDIENL